MFITRNNFQWLKTSSLKSSVLGAILLWLLNESQFSVLVIVHKLLSEIVFKNVIETIPWVFYFNTGTTLVQCLIIGGCVDSFGVLYTTIQQRFDASAIQVAWIPATMSFLYLITGNYDKWFNLANIQFQSNHLR